MLRDVQYSHRSMQGATRRRRSVCLVVGAHVEPFDEERVSPEGDACEADDDQFFHLAHGETPACQRIKNASAFAAWQPREQATHITFFHR